MFRKSSTCLDLLGLYPGTANAVRMVWISVVLMLILPTFVLMVYTMIIDIGLKDYTDATRQVSGQFLLLIMYIKTINLLANAPKIASIIATCNADYFDESFTKRQRDIIKRYTILGRLTQDFWCSIVLITGISFFLLALLLTAYSYFSSETFTKQMLFYTIYPWYDDLKFKTPFYEIMFVYQSTLDMFVMFLYAGFEPLTPIFILHLCARLQIVKEGLLSLYDFNSENYVPESKRKLSKIVENLQKIYKLGEDISIVSRSVYEPVFFFTSLLTTFSAYQIFSGLQNGEIRVEFICVFLGALIHSFIPCFYGDMIIEKSLSIHDTVYFNNWELAPNSSIRATLLIIMMRAQKPISIETILQPVSLRLFSEATHKSFAFFNLLLAVFN